MNSSLCVDVLGGNTSGEGVGKQADGTSATAAEHAGSDGMQLAGLSLYLKMLSLPCVYVLMAVNSVQVFVLQCFSGHVSTSLQELPKLNHDRDIFSPSPIKNILHSIKKFNL